MSEPVISLVLGGARSGKSEVAERLAARQSVRAQSGVTYVATGSGGTGDAGADDAAFLARIQAHRRRRPSEWKTIEVRRGAELGEALAEPGVMLVDSLGTWVAGWDGFEADVKGLLAALERRRRVGDPTILVSDEVGLGVHPETAAGNLFRDALGALNRCVAEMADEVVLVVAGRLLVLGPEDELGS